MDGSKGVGSSSSSLTWELFGSKDPISSSSAIFGSIFAPPPMVLGRESLLPDSMTNRQDSPNEPWNPKPGASGNSSRGHGCQNQNKGNSSSYREQRVQPCNLSSSIYYGGQDDIYPPPPTIQGSGLNSMYKKDGGEEDSGIASRGNWWLGSVYY